MTRRLLIVAFLSIAFVSFSQKQGMIVYEMVTDSAALKDNRINNVKIEVAYSGDVSQMKIFIGAKIGFSWLVREKGMKTVRFSMELDNQKLLVDDYPLDSLIARKHANDDLKFSFVKNADKKILKYKCKKAILQSAIDRPIELFVTTQLKQKISIFEKLFKGIKGTPLEFTLTTGSGRKMIFRAKWIYAEVTNSVFKLPTDYKRISYSEFYKKMGNIGFGF